MEEDLNTYQGLQTTTAVICVECGQNVPCECEVCGECPQICQCAEPRFPFQIRSTPPAQTHTSLESLNTKLQSLSPPVQSQFSQPQFSPRVDNESSVPIIGSSSLLARFSPLLYEDDIEDFDETEPQQQATASPSLSESHWSTEEQTGQRVLIVPIDEERDVMQAFASLSVSELQVHLPLLLMWPVSKLQHIESNPAHTSNLAPIVAASDDEADLRKDSKTLDKQAKQQIKQERAQREKKETEELVQDPQFRLPEEYTKMPIEPEPVHIVNARKAKLGVDLAEKEDESTDTDHDSDLETFLTDHPKDKEKLAQMQQSPVEPVTLLGERGHPHDQTLPEYLEPGTEVDEEPDASPVHTDKQKTHTCEFVDDAAEESENEETIDPSFFFYAVPTGSTTGKQQLMMMEEDGTCRLATAEERAYYHSLETDSDDD